MGIKAKVKQELKSLGIKTIKNDSGVDIKLGNAKTSDLISALAKIEEEK